MQRQTASHLFKVRELRHMAEVFLCHGHQVRLLPDSNRVFRQLTLNLASSQVIQILESKKGQEIDMQELFARFTLDSIGGTAS